MYVILFSQHSFSGFQLTSKDNDVRQCSTQRLWFELKSNTMIVIFEWKSRTCRVVDIFVFVLLFTVKILSIALLKYKHDSFLDITSMSYIVQCLLEKKWMIVVLAGEIFQFFLFIWVFFIIQGFLLLAYFGFRLVSGFESFNICSSWLEWIVNLLKNALT